jgi:hypothetical protein
MTRSPPPGSWAKVAPASGWCGGVREIASAWCTYISLKPLFAQPNIHVRLVRLLDFLQFVPGLQGCVGVICFLNLLGGAKDEHFSHIHSSCQLGLSCLWPSRMRSCCLLPEGVPWPPRMRCIGLKDTLGSFLDTVGLVSISRQPSRLR